MRWCRFSRARGLGFVRMSGRGFRGCEGFEGCKVLGFGAVGRQDSLKGLRGSDHAGLKEHRARCPTSHHPQEQA